MGMFSSPSFPKRPKQEGQLFSEAQAMQTEATGFASGMRARLADIANTTDELQRTARIVSGDMWQADAGAGDTDWSRPGATGLARALGRGKALTRMAMVGERGPELVNLPRGSQVFPNGSGPATRVEVIPSPYFSVVVDGRIASAAPAIADAGGRLGAQRMASAAEWTLK